ncbi:hypothetical protein M434DRAFT_276813 [Hypoxylon sp. CO27-5]|nr:hypothetical protein M434DRAFT_276813 [Hypoxylon sp. CO27-5]
MPLGDHAFLFKSRQWVRAPRAPRRLYRGRTGGSISLPVSLDTLYAPLSCLSELKSSAASTLPAAWVCTVSVRGCDEIKCPGPRSHGRAPPLRRQYSPLIALWKATDVIQEVRDNLGPIRFEIMRRTASIGILRRSQLPSADELS